MTLDLPPDTGPLAPEWRTPLELVASTQQGERLAHFLCVEDFMIMARVIRPPRPTVVLYKHAFTRSYLNLDAAGQAYRYISVRGSSHGRYVRRPIADALRAVGLDQLPWLKPGLEAEQRGLPWEDHVRLRIMLDREYTARGRPPPEVSRPPRRRRHRPVDERAADGAPSGPRGDCRHLRLVEGFG